MHLTAAPHIDSTCMAIPARIHSLVTSHAFGRASLLVSGSLLASFSFTLTAELSRFELVDMNDIFYDCVNSASTIIATMHSYRSRLYPPRSLYVPQVRRLKIYSDAKIFIMDNLQFAVSSADDQICGLPAGSSATATVADELDSAATGILPHSPFSMLILSTASTLLVLWLFGRNK